MAILSGGLGSDGQLTPFSASVLLSKVTASDPAVPTQAVSSLCKLSPRRSESIIARTRITIKPTQHSIQVPSLC